MSAVWRTARSAIRRRRVQTAVLGLVVFSSTVAVVVALGLLEAASAPFDRAFAQYRGAHVSASFSRDDVSDGQLEATAGRPGVEATAGPFEQVVVTLPDDGTELVPGLVPGPLMVVGRASPDGPVDRVRVHVGRWATGPGELVVAGPGSEELLGRAIGLSDGRRLTIVGYAESLTGTANAWVTPRQAAELGPDSVQMLYRFTDAATASEVRDSTERATGALPSRALQSTVSYLTVKDRIGSVANAYLPYLLGFGVLGLAVAVLIVANVVSGAVVAGFRAIGILKSVGFTPRQVVAVHLTAVLVPAAAGSLLGTAVGSVALGPLVDTVFFGVGAQNLSVSVGTWVLVAPLLGMPALAAVAALVPALRAGRLSAARAISAGSAPRAGRGRGIQHRLAGTRLPRSLSLGLGLPFARPGRSALTLAAVLLGVTTVTLAAGLAATLTAFGKAVQGTADTVVYAGRAAHGETTPRQGDLETEALLHSLPGASEVVALAWLDLYLAGDPQRIQVQFIRGEYGSLGGETIVEGRTFESPDEVVAASQFLDERGMKVGDRLTLTWGDRKRSVTIVGAMLGGNRDLLEAGWETLGGLAPEQKATQYWVQLTADGDAGAYNAAVRKADPGLRPQALSTTDANVVAIVGSASVIALLLAVVAALGVFNTVLLDAHERRRDLGVLKSIGMTPRQVTVMMTASMAALGAVGAAVGVPLGLGAHRLVVPAMTEAAGLRAPSFLMDVWHTPVIVLLGLSGVVIAIGGALVPARSAGRLTVAQALHNE
ncbi:ABC transporter permease [Streptomyces wuyuanensis]|uniref:ABC transporter permease n=1 Tax=Streptomyces wuyuanensis TaxID=1196353 RepID=UPI00341C9140